MEEVVKTENHPNKKRKILGPIGRFVLTDSVDVDKNALMDKYHLVQGRNKIFYKPGEK